MLLGKSRNVRAFNKSTQQTKTIENGIKSEGDLIKVLRKPKPKKILSKKKIKEINKYFSELRTYVS